MSKILGIHTPYEVKNLAINGGLDFWQEKVGTTTTVNTAATSGYSADMFKFDCGGPTTKNFSLVRSTDVPTFSESGFQSTYSALFTMITALGTLASGDYVNPFIYHVEGLDYAKIHGGTVTFGFRVKASVVGTYSFALRNNGGTRSYVTTFQVNNANTWEFKSITVRLDTSGTWLFDTGIGLSAYIGPVSGSTFQTATLNTWLTGNFLSASTGTNFLATAGATLRVSQFSITEGSLGFGPLGFQRAGKSIQQELAMCQRYYEKTYDQINAPNTATQNGEIAGYVHGTVATSGYIQWSQNFAVTKRSQPAVTLYSYLSGAGTIGVGGVNRTAAPADIGTTGFGAIQNQSGVSWTDLQTMLFHYIADARL